MITNRNLVNVSIILIIIWSPFPIFTDEYIKVISLIKDLKRLSLSLSLSLSHWFIKGRIIVSLTVLEYPRVHTSGKSTSPWLRIYKSWKPDGATELHLSSHRHYSLSAAVVFQNGDRAIAKSVSSDSMPALGKIFLFFVYS